MSDIISLTITRIRQIIAFYKENKHIGLSTITYALKHPDKVSDSFVSVFYGDVIIKIINDLDSMIPFGFTNSLFDEELFPEYYEKNALDRATIINTIIPLILGARILEYMGFYFPGHNHTRFDASLRFVPRAMSKDRFNGSFVDGGYTAVDRSASHGSFIAILRKKVHISATDFLVLNHEASQIFHEPEIFSGLLEMMIDKSLLPHIKGKRKLVMQDKFERLHILAIFMKAKLEGKTTVALPGKKGTAIKTVNIADNEKDLKAVGFSLEGPVLDLLVEYTRRYESSSMVSEVPIK